VIQVAHCGDGLHVSFLNSVGGSSTTPDVASGSLGGEGGMTCYSRFGVLQVATVRARQVNGEAQ